MKSDSEPQRAMKPLPPHPRTALFAASLARDVVQLTERVETESGLRIEAERLHGLPRVINIGGVGSIAKGLLDAQPRIETQLRTLRNIISELRDFVR
jgi:hypothetical protein